MSFSGIDSEKAVILRIYLSVQFWDNGLSCDFNYLKDLRRALLGVQCVFSFVLVVWLGVKTSCSLCVSPETRSAPSLQKQCSFSQVSPKPGSLPKMVAVVVLSEKVNKITRNKESELNKLGESQGELNLKSASVFLRCSVSKTVSPRED